MSLIWSYVVTFILLDTYCTSSHKCTGIPVSVEVSFKTEILDSLIFSSIQIKIWVKGSLALKSKVAHYDNDDNGNINSDEHNNDNHTFIQNYTVLDQADGQE